MELFFDTETSGFYNSKLQPEDVRQSWIAQLAMILSDGKTVIGSFHAYIGDEGRIMTEGAFKVHGIGKEITSKGLDELLVADIFLFFLSCCDLAVAHNYDFDWPFMAALLVRSGLGMKIPDRPHVCTMKASTNLLQLPARHRSHGKYKWPKLEELYTYLFNEEIKGAHNAIADVRAMRRCYYELKERGVV